jgi:hypothetical protein
MEVSFLFPYSNTVTSYSSTFIPFTSIYLCQIFDKLQQRFNQFKETEVNQCRDFINQQAIQTVEAAQLAEQLSCQLLTYFTCEPLQKISEEKEINDFLILVIDILNFNWHQDPFILEWKNFFISNLCQIIEKLPNFNTIHISTYQKAKDCCANILIKTPMGMDYYNRLVKALIYAGNHPLISEKEQQGIFQLILTSYTPDKLDTLGYRLNDFIHLKHYHLSIKEQASQLILDWIKNRYHPIYNEIYTQTHLNHVETLICTYRIKLIDSCCLFNQKKELRTIYKLGITILLHIFHNQNEAENIRIKIIQKLGKLKEIEKKVIDSLYQALTVSSPSIQKSIINALFSDLSFLLPENKKFQHIYPLYLQLIDASNLSENIHIELAYHMPHQTIFMTPTISEEVIHLIFYMFNYIKNQQGSIERKRIYTHNITTSLMNEELAIRCAQKSPYLASSQTFIAALGFSAELTQCAKLAIKTLHTSYLEWARHTECFMSQ